MPRDQDLITGREATPEQIVATTLETGSRSIAYTYTEPTIFFEYAYDTSRLAHAAGLTNLYITNGYMTVEMLDFFHPYLDAANVDLKAFREKTYHHYVGAGLQPVLDSMKAMKRLGIWLEVTTLGNLAVGENVNLEVDLIARYLDRLNQYGHSADKDVLSGS